jgi:hypothetical protein
MNLKRSPWLSAAIVSLCSFILPLQNAYAYVDPGTGSYMLQLLMAALFGAAFTIKTYWRKIKAFFSKPATDEKEQGEHD